MTTRNTHFGSLLRDRRTATGTTLGDVAAALGCSVSYVSDVEHGRRNPFNNEQMTKLAKLLDCQVEELLRASAKDMQSVRFDDDREERLEVAASLARFLKVSDADGIKKLREYLAKQGVLFAGDSRGFTARRGRSAAELDRLALRARREFCPHLEDCESFDALRTFETLHTRSVKFKGDRVPLETRVMGLPRDVEAFTRFDAAHNEFLVVLSEATYSGLRSSHPRDRFTLAHELGHVCLHLAELVTLRALPDFDRVFMRATANHPPYLDVEWQANTFGSRVLVPDAGLHMLQQIGPITEAVIVQRFRVSPEMARVRLAQFHGEKEAA